MCSIKCSAAAAAVLTHSLPVEEVQVQVEVQVMDVFSVSSV